MKRLKKPLPVGVRTDPRAAEKPSGPAGDGGGGRSMNFRYFVFTFSSCETVSTSLENAPGAIARLLPVPPSGNPRERPGGDEKPKLEKNISPLKFLNLFCLKLRLHVVCKQSICGRGATSANQLHNA
jgi:hypothetical protein